MFIINIKIKSDLIAKDRANELLASHRQWFEHHFKNQNFILLGPYLDQKDSGVIIAKTPNKAELDEILAQDFYYPDLAEYEVREFYASMARIDLRAEQILKVLAMTRPAKWQCGKCP